MIALQQMCFREGVHAVAEVFSYVMGPGMEFVVAIAVQTNDIYSNIIVHVDGDVFDCCGRGERKMISANIVGCNILCTDCSSCIVDIPNACAE